VDGKVDAQPLYLSQLTVAGAAHNVVFVATEHDSVVRVRFGHRYSFVACVAATFGRVLERHARLQPGNSQHWDNVDPVIDRSAGTHGAIYVVAMSKDQSSAYHQRLHALDVTTGAELFNGPVAITATYTAPGSVATGFEPGQYEERAALLLSQGIVYTSWTSHCDAPPYSGWIMGYNQTTLAQTSVLNIAPNNNSGPAIWMAGGGPGADSSGNIYLLSANGAFETTMDSNGFPNKQDYGNSFLKIAATGGKLSVADYFTMSNVVAESNADQDLGSGGELLLPDLTDSTNTVRHLNRRSGQGRQHLCRQSRLHGEVQCRRQQYLAAGEWRVARWHIQHPGLFQRHPVLRRQWRDSQGIRHHGREAHRHALLTVGDAVSLSRYGAGGVRKRNVERYRVGT